MIALRTLCRKSCVVLLIKQVPLHPKEAAVVRTLSTGTILRPNRAQASEMSKKDTEFEDFNKQFQNVLTILQSHDDAVLKEPMDWFKRVLEYNVPHGKKNRGMSLVQAFKTLCSEKNPTLLTPENITRAQLIGWAIELLQAYFLIIDDVMDQSVTRRGQPCWYKLEDVQLKSLNDAILTEQGIYKLLKRIAGDQPYYLDVVELFHKISMNTSLGQCMDTNVQNNFDNYNMDRYNGIVKYKTSYYTFCLPVQTALYMAGIKDAGLHEIAEDILLKMGRFFQIQDDYLDCFGNPEVTGKEGTDIQENKCAWPLVTALPLANDKQNEILKENYGRHDLNCVKKVKEVYAELGVEGLFKKYEDQTYEELTSLVNKNAHLIPPETFMWYMRQIFKRQN